MERAEMEITPTELKARLDAGEDVRLVDVRGSDEHALAALPGSELLPLDQLPHRIDELEQDEDIVLYCHHGIRSLDAALFLRSQGFARVKSLAGGIDLWSQTVDPGTPRY